MDKIFLDTDVILDFLLDRDPHSKDSTLLFNLSEQEKIKIVVSSLSYNNIYYITRKFIGHKEAINVLRSLSELTEISEVNAKIIKNALMSNFNDFEDGVQYFSAENEGTVKAIITRNIQDYKHSEIAVFTPEDYLKSLE
ncbi:MAG TPA: PIN domain-containing protein [Cytophagales bacterium]|nr:PIN domain-containing protein [Cytophagales bacterium]